MKKPLVKTESEKSDLKPLEMDAQLLAVTSAGPVSDEERKEITHVLNRFDRMRSARIALDRLWQTYMLQYESQYIPYADGRSRSNVPLERAIIELFVSESLGRRAKEEIKGIGDTDQSKAEAMRRVKDYVDSKCNVEDELTKSDYVTAEFGTCAYLTAYQEDARVIQDIEYLKDGSEDFVTKLARDNRVIVKTLDIRNVYFDDRTTDFDDDVDQILIDYVTPEQFKALEFNESYEFKNLNKIGEYVKSEQCFWTAEDRAKLHTGLVEIMHYWNKRADKYVVLANRGQVIRSGPNPYAHKELPIVPRVYGYVPYRKYGIGLCEALLNFKSSFNKLHEMIMDGINRSNNSMFVVANGLTFDGNSFGFDNSLRKANKPLTPDSFQEIKGQQPNSAIFNYSNDLLRQVAIFVGIDPAAIIGEASSTAFETAVRTETSMKRVNVALRNRDASWKRVQRRHISNIMQFFSRKEARELLEIVDGEVQEGKETYPSINLKGENFVHGKFVKAEDDYLFEVRPEYIRGNYDIEVQTNFSAPTLKQVKMDSLKKFMDAVNTYGLTLQASPQLADALPFEDFMKQAAFTFDIDLQSVGGMKESIAKAKKKLMEDVKNTLGVMPGLPGQSQPSPMGQGQPPMPQQPQGGVRQKVGGVMTPNTPDINNMSSPAVMAMA